jgi:hypothetical protein
MAALELEVDLATRLGDLVLARDQAVLEHDPDHQDETCRAQKDGQEHTGTGHRRASLLLPESAAQCDTGAMVKAGLRADD